MGLRRDSIMEIGRRICSHTIGNMLSQVAVGMAIGQSKHCSSAPQLPWLLLRSTSSFSLKDHCFLSLSDLKIYKPNPTFNINRLDCLGSIEGWLIMVDNEFLQPEGFRSFHILQDESRSSFTTVNFFLNPISGDRVMLPSQSTIPCENSNQVSFFKKVVASSAPTSPHCVVAGLCSDSRLAFCRPIDMSWTLIDEEEARGLQFCDIEIIDGKLYAATREASEFIMVFHIEDAVTNFGNATYSASNLVMLDPGPIPLLINTRNAVLQDEVYLARDSTSKELFMIFHRNYFVREEDPIIQWSTIIGCDNFVAPPKSVGFRVFKLEFDTGGARWVEVCDLCDEILFVSKASNIFISLDSDFEYDSREKGLDKNCICFAFDNPCLESPSSGRDVGVFSMTNKSITHFDFLKDYFRTELHTRPIWFTPNL